MIALVFGILMAIRVALTLFAFGSLGGYFFADASLLIVAFLIPIGLAIVVYYLSRKARRGDADALRWLKVVFTMVGCLALINVGIVLSPLITIAFCGISFVMMCIQPFARAFDALNRANGTIS